MTSNAQKPDTPPPMAGMDHAAMGHGAESAAKVRSRARRRWTAFRNRCSCCTKGRQGRHPIGSAGRDYGAGEVLAQACLFGTWRRT
jgi:hypothetical protein